MLKNSWEVKLRISWTVVLVISASNRQSLVLKMTKPVIYRLGGVTQEEIESVIGKVDARTHSTSNPKTPGQLQSHYAPRKKLILGDLKELISKYSSGDFGILSFKDDFDSPYQFILSPNGQLSEAAQNLFSALRTLDKMPVDIILAEPVPDIGLGKAINDRLRRASN